jgi:hypothetical protein
MVELCPRRRHGVASVPQSDSTRRTSGRGCPSRHRLSPGRGGDTTIPTVSKNNFLNAKSQLETLRAVAARLIVADAPPSPRQVSQMQASCAKVRDIFVEEHASAMRRNDEADNG